MQKMKNRKKKGFTLIELLAVIVILAILALIAIPIVISIIRDSRENANKRSIQAYGRAVENAIATWQSKNDGEAPNSISAYKIEMSGEKVECNDEIKGTDGDDGIELTNCKVVDSNGNPKSKNTYTYKGGKVTKTGTVESNHQQSYQAYNVGEIVKVNNMDDEYYVIANSGEDQDYVTALKAEPLTVDEVNTYGAGHINRYSADYGAYDTSNPAYNVNGYGGMLYYSHSSGRQEEQCGYDRYSGQLSSGGCKNDYEQSDVKYVVEQWAASKFTQNELKTVDNYSVRLIKTAEIEMEDYHYCSQFQGCYDIKRITHDWIYQGNYWYWTMNASDNEYSVQARVLGNSSYYINDRNVFDKNTVVRPVINVKKSAIQN